MIFKFIQILQVSLLIHQWVNCVVYIFFCTKLIFLRYLIYILLNDFIWVNISIRVISANLSIILVWVPELLIIFQLFIQIVSQSQVLDTQFRDIYSAILPAVHSIDINRDHRSSYLIIILHHTFWSNVWFMFCVLIWFLQRSSLVSNWLHS